MREKQNQNPNLKLRMGYPACGKNVFQRKYLMMQKWEELMKTKQNQSPDLKLEMGHPACG